MDLADRKIIGWTLSEGMSAEQTSVAALERALKVRRVENGLIFHSDRGVQYPCNDFKDKLKSLKIEVVQSMSRKGNCWDNSAMQNFFKRLKVKNSTVTTLKPGKRLSYVCLGILRVGIIKADYIQQLGIRHLVS